MLSSHNFLPLLIRLLRQQLLLLQHLNNHHHQQVLPTNRMLRRSMASGWYQLVANQPHRSLRSLSGRNVIWLSNNGKSKNGVNAGAKKSSKRRRPRWINIIPIFTTTRIHLRAMHLLTALRPGRLRLRPHQQDPPSLYRLPSHLTSAHGPSIIGSKARNRLSSLLLRDRRHQHPSPSLNPHRANLVQRPTRLRPCHHLIRKLMRVSLLLNPRTHLRHRPPPLQHQGSLLHLRTRPRSKHHPHLLP